jgi:hypothetical protein
LGDRIKINNDYPHIVTVYSRNYLIGAAKKAQALYG